MKIGKIESGAAFGNRLLLARLKKRVSRYEYYRVSFAGALASWLVSGSVLDLFAQNLGRA